MLLFTGSLFAFELLVSDLCGILDLFLNSVTIFSWTLHISDFLSIKNIARNLVESNFDPFSLLLAFVLITHWQVEK